MIKDTIDLMEKCAMRILYCCDAIAVRPAVGRWEDRLSPFFSNFGLAQAEGLEGVLGHFSTTPTSCNSGYRKETTIGQ